MSHNFNSTFRDHGGSVKSPEYKNLTYQKVDLHIREAVQKRNLRESSNQDKERLNDQDSDEDGVIPFSDEEEQLEIAKRVTNQTSFYHKTNLLVMSVVAVIIMGITMFAVYRLWISFARNKHS
jgi:hypothetical protein